MHRKEKDPKARARLLACMYRKEGKSIAEIAGILGTPRATVGDWISRIARGGIRRRHDVKNRGAACKIDGGQRRRLVKDLLAGPEAFNLGAGAWTVPLIARHIKKEFGVDYNVHSVWDLIRRMGFSYSNQRRAGPGEAAQGWRREIKKMPP